MTEVKNPGNGFAWCGNVPTPWRAFLSYLEVPSAHILKNQNPETNPKKKQFDANLNKNHLEPPPLEPPPFTVPSGYSSFEECWTVVKQKLGGWDETEGLAYSG